MARPFAKNRDGISLGDGASAVVLEDRESARARDATIYAEYVNGGFRLEGGHAAAGEAASPGEAAVFTWPETPVCVPCVPYVPVVVLPLAPTPTPTPGVTP